MKYSNYSYGRLTVTRNMLRMCVVVCLMVLAIVPVYTQTLIGGKLQLFDAATPYQMFLSPPSPLSANITITLPGASGTLLVNQGSGVSNAWLGGGNSLAGSDYIGSTTAHDVILIAGGGSNSRLTLVAASNAVTNHDAGEFRFAEPVAGGSDYSAFKAGTQGATFVYTLPLTVPAANQVLTATAVSGQDVTLSWLGAGGWLLGGNTSVTNSNNIVGIAEVNANPLRFFTNNLERMQIASDGSVAIGTVPLVGYKLAVAGNIRMVDATSSTIAGATACEIRETGDMHGTSGFTVQNRPGVHGALITTVPSNPTVNLADLGLKVGAHVQNNLRLEFRPSTIRNNSYNSGLGEFNWFFNTNGTTPTYTTSMGPGATSFETGNVGIGHTNPLEKFTVGTSSQEFRVNSTGNLRRINNVPYSWPAAAAGANGYVLSSTTGGNLSWVKASSVTAVTKRVLVNGGGGAVYVINEPAVTATSAIIVIPENGSNVNITGCHITDRDAGVSFEVTFNNALGVGTDKYLNYMIID